ncbi:hypothetical protein [Comamonas aquatica]|nr:hypothetical protein [Comamonas aquatica]
MQEDLNAKKSIVSLKERLVSVIPYVPRNAESKSFLLNKDISDLLHIHHFWRQRFIQASPRKFFAPSNVRNDPLYVQLKKRIEPLKRKIEAGEDVSAYLSSRAHERAIDISDYKKSCSFSASRDQLLVCEGFFHLHLAPRPERTDEILVAQVTPETFEVVGIFTHELFDESGLNPSYSKYDKAIDAYLARRLPSGGAFLGGPGGGLQNAAGSSVVSTFWATRCYRVLIAVELYSAGLEGFTIKLYDEIFTRKPSFVKPIWDVTNDGYLLIRDRKNKCEFWVEYDGKWKGKELSS